MSLKKNDVLFLIDLIELCSSAWRSLRRGKFKQSDVTMVEYLGQDK